MSEPKDNSGAANQAARDALASRKADTQGWSDVQRQTYEAIHNATKKSSN